VDLGLRRIRAGYLFTPYPESFTLLEDLLKDAETLADDRLIAETHLWLARLRHAHGDFLFMSPESQESLQRARQIGEALGDPHLLALPLALEGLFHYFGADFRAAVRVLEEAAPLLERYENFRDASFSAGAAGASRALLGDFAGAGQWVLRSSDLAKRSGDPFARADARIWASLVEWARGDMDRVRELAGDALDLAERADHKVCVVGASVILGDTELREGQPRRAVPPLERGIEVAQYCDAGPLENRARALLSVARFDLEEVPDPTPELESALDRARQFRDRLAEGQILDRRAVARTRLPVPDWQAAFEDFEESLRVFREIETLPFEARALRDFGLALQASGRVEEGREKVVEATRLFRKLGLHDAPQP
jgi:tetratricopeptide (TPR) repeat protein